MTVYIKKSSVLHKKKPTRKNEFGKILENQSPGHAGHLTGNRF